MLGAGAFGVLALARGETISAAWLVVAAVCSYLVAYRFYSRFIAEGLRARSAARDAGRAAEQRPRLRADATSGCSSAITSRRSPAPGPLVGPTLAAQFGFLPGTLWLIVGVVLGGAVQDFVILCASMRRDGKSLGQMAKEEVNPVAGMAAMVAIFAIMIILLAVLALVVVNALRDSPWGLFTIACTIPIALLMGWWMNRLRPGKVAEATVIGIVLLLAALVGGQWVSESPTWGPAFTWSGTQLAWAVMVYGFVASVLPVWLLLAPRDYLSAFMKIGTILVLGLGDHVRAAAAQDAGAHAVHRRHRPGVRRQALPVRVHHDRLRRHLGLPRAGLERHDAEDADARDRRALVGYGSMLTESLVGIMALIAACDARSRRLLRDQRRARRRWHDSPRAAAGDREWGFRRPRAADALARQMGEATLLSRTGGAPSLAVGMAASLGGVFGGAGLALWYHFAIMFEAVFILTTIDAGTRVGRFMLQELLGARLWAPLGPTSWYPSIVLSSLLVVARLGLLPLSGRGRSARRHQLAVAAVRHRQPAAGGRRAVRRRPRCSSRWGRCATRG